MSQYKANEKHERHLKNMDYTALQNAIARAVNNENWEELTRLQHIEKQMFQ